MDERKIEGENVVIHEGVGDIVGGAGKNVTGVKAGGDARADTGKSNGASRLALLVRLAAIIAGLIVIGLGAVGWVPWKVAGPVAGVLIGLPSADLARKN